MESMPDVQRLRKRGLRMNQSENRFYREKHMVESNEIGLGHNQPPIDPLDPLTLKERLERDYAPMFVRFAELEQGAARVPEKVTDEVTAVRIVDWVAKQVRPLEAEAKAAHKNEKNPFRVCGLVVDDIFLRRLDKLAVVVKKVEARAKAYRDAKEAAQRKAEAEARERAARERLEAEERARKLREEAEREITKENAKSAAELAAAAEIAEEAARAAAVREQAPELPVRIHGEYGATGYDKPRWKFKVVNLALVPIEYLKPTTDDEVIQAAIHNGVREIPGLEIYDASQFIIKKC